LEFLGVRLLAKTEHAHPLVIVDVGISMGTQGQVCAECAHVLIALGPVHFALDLGLEL
jgi:hypothetical protein